MSVFVKGMNMPRSCKQCEMFNLVKSINDFRCCANDEWHEANFDYHNERHPDCPLVEIPTPHGRLIDADKLIRFIENGLNKNNNPFGYDAVEILTEIEFDPTIIEAEVSE